MRTETSTSPLPPCLLQNLALSAAQFPQPQPFAQVTIHTRARTHRHTLSHTYTPLLMSLSPISSLIGCLCLPAGSGECLEHGYVLNSRYQVVYPFPTFQPAFQLKKDQVILLNTSYSLVACGISLCPGDVQTQSST